MILARQEERIKNIIQNYARDEYDGLISNEEWPVFQELTSLRENLLSWYPFTNGARVLEYAEGYGALTGVLSQRCGSVVVVAESITKAECIQARYADRGNVDVRYDRPCDDREKYDYIIIDRPVSTNSELRKMLAETSVLLADRGTVLLVCMNRFALREFCGAPSAGELPFERVRNNTGTTYQGIISCLEGEKWIDCWRIYFPFPDHILPQAVYTNEYLPKKSVRDRVIPYYTEEQRKSLLILEDELYDGLIENGMFHVLANSFLIECNREKASDHVIYAVLSKDREKGHGFSTTIMHSGHVRKAALDPAGNNSLVQMYQNTLELMKRGIHCVPLELDEGSLRMPYIKGNTLIEYLKECYADSEDRVVYIFDLLYREILNSSAHVPQQECAMENVDTERTDLGEILERAYIDMIPYNAFYLDGKLCFFDQEFVCNNYPAKYVLFRAIRYTYIYITEAQDIIPIQFLKDRYALNGLWETFEQVESRFVENNRNYGALGCFYKWADVNRGILDENVNKLRADTRAEGANWQRKERNLDRYYKDVALSKVKEVHLNLLRNFQRVCAENDMSYCAFYGTLLGSIRHGGVIPWDDDIDILMPRADYDKLLKIAHIVFDEPLFLQTPENDRQCFYGGYCKLRDSNTSGIETRNVGHACHQGIWIDIFPLDYVPADREQREEQFQNIKAWQRMILAKVYPEKAEWRIYDSDRYTLDELYRKLHEAMTGTVSAESDKVAVLARYYNGEWYQEYDAADFAFLIKHKFEDGDIYIPVGYEHCLKADYGDDYMIYPTEKERHRHHDAVYSTEIPYKEWLGYS